MATALNVMKMVNSLVRSRLTTMHELSEVYRSGVARNRETIIEFLKENDVTDIALRIYNGLATSLDEPITDGEERFSSDDHVTEDSIDRLPTRSTDDIVGVTEKAERAAKSETARKLRVFKTYYSLEMSPPNKGDLQKLQSDFALAKEFIQSGCYKYLTVKQAWLLFLVCTEVGLWFFLGETIGKMHIVGYKV